MNPLQQEEDNANQNNPSYCPSFNTYTTHPQIAEIASRVVAIDLNNTNCDFFDYYHNDDFEFDLSEKTFPDSLQVYPVFNRDLLRDLGSEETSTEKTTQLRKLFFEEDINNNDELARLSEELNGVSPETYCLWAPKSPGTPSPSRCMKSSSTGSGPGPAVAKTWRLRNLLRRCKSDGKEGLMLVSDSPKKNKEKTRSSRPPTSPGWGGGSNSKEAGARRRKSYLPYKQDLLGFFGSPQTLRRINIPPF